MARNENFIYFIRKNGIFNQNHISTLNINKNAQYIKLTYKQGKKIIF